MPRGRVLNHKHDWRWNEWYFEGGDPVHCRGVSGKDYFAVHCTATLTMTQLIERANAFEEVGHVVKDWMQRGVMGA